MTTTHLNLETGQHPDRSYFSTLLAAQPQFDADRLIEDVQAEIRYWTGLLTDAPAGQAFTMTFDNMKDAIDALRHESKALKNVAKALQAHGAGAWADASNYYTRAVSDLRACVSRAGTSAHWCFRA